MIDYFRASPADSAIPVGRRHLKKTHELSRRFCGNGNVCSLCISAQVTRFTAQYSGPLDLINKKALFVAARFIIDNQMNPVKNHRNPENWLILRVSLPRKKGLARYFSCPLIPKTTAGAFHRPSTLFFSKKHSVSLLHLMSRKNRMISCKNPEKKGGYYRNPTGFQKFTTEIMHSLHRQDSFLLFSCGEM